MTDWGEALAGEDDDPPVVDREPGEAFGIDIGALAAELVTEGLRTELRKLITTAVSGALDDVLVEDLVEDLRARAATAARRAVSSGLGVPEDSPPVAPALYFSDVDEFVREYLRYVYRRRIDGRSRVWAGRWWEHDEAVIRLEGLWRSWEAARLDPANGMAVWWRDQADHHMSVLMSPDGPFATATDGDENLNDRGGPLPYVPPPAGLFGPA